MTGLLVLAATVVACGEPDKAGNPIDQDGDGVSDALGKAVDSNLDQVIDQVDFNNDGILDGPGVDVDGDGYADGIGLDTDGDGVYDALDTNLDGIPDTYSQPPVGAGGTGAGGTGAGGTFGTGGVGSGGFGSGGVLIGSGGIGSGGGLGTGGGGTTVACTFEVPVSEAAMLMPTVGVVEFSSSLAGITSAQIDFGKTMEYGMTAPVDLMEPNYHTLLLGMAPNTAYHYKITVSNGAESCSSDDMSIMTGGLRTGVATPSQVMTGPNTSPGFIITVSGNSVIILNNEGEVVWGYAISNLGGGGGGPGGAGLGLFSGKMSWDGKYVYTRDLGPFDAGSGGTIWRIELDGSGDMALPLKGGHHHDFTVTPDGIAYIGKNNAGECDNIYTAGPDGSNPTVLLNLDAVFGNYQTNGASTEKCHVNAINYIHEEQMYTVSDREKDVIGFVSAAGQPIMTVGQNPNGTNSFTTVVAQGAGDSNTWRVQHGHHYYAENKLLVFSNGNFGGGTSRVLHYTINGTSATVDWTYMGVGNSGTQGDTEALPNGNFLLTGSMGGNIHEIDANQQLVSSYKFSSLGYTDYRMSLYGPPRQH